MPRAPTQVNNDSDSMLELAVELALELTHAALERRQLLADLLEVGPRREVQLMHDRALSLVERGLAPLHGADRLGDPRGPLLVSEDPLHRLLRKAHRFGLQSLGNAHGATPGRVRI